MSTKVYIKNMVCLRCINAVKEVFLDLDIPVIEVKLGQVALQEPLPENKREQVEETLQSLGFAFASDRKSQIMEQMKNLVIEHVHGTDEMSDIKWASLVSDNLNLDYKYLSTLFSSITGVTFEQYIIKHKIERVKELMVYDELSLSEIAYRLNYSSVAYLSNQFKRMTGMSPSEFKRTAVQNRSALDEL